MSMSNESPKRVLFGQFAAVAKAAAHPYRLELLEQLAQGERSVEVLADRLKLSVANASQHLQHMRRGGLVAARRDGKFVFYRLADDAVLDLVAALRRVAGPRTLRVPLPDTRGPSGEVTIPAVAPFPEDPSWTISVTLTPSASLQKNSRLVIAPRSPVPLVSPSSE